MKGARAPRFGSTNLSTNDDLPQPEIAVGQLLVKAIARRSQSDIGSGSGLKQGLAKSASTKRAIQIIVSGNSSDQPARLRA
jgi:hypothetical protein